MQREGHDVRTATDGQAALDAIAEARPDLLLLDLMMPRGNGYEVCRTLRASPDYNDVRIIMLTARGQESDQRTRPGARRRCLCHQALRHRRRRRLRRRRAGPAARPGAG